LPAGEYRSHLRVKIIDDNVEASTAAANPDNTKKQAQILFKANLVLIIPVIVPVTALISTHTEKCSTGRPRSDPTDSRSRYQNPRCFTRSRLSTDHDFYVAVERREEIH
jgi:hypothetical protein